jgi:hypothetical protein
VRSEPPEDDGPRQDDEDDGDPFAGLTLDDEFVRSAAVTEPTAHERERAARQEDLRRRLAEQATQAEGESPERQRYGADPFDVGGEWSTSANRPRRVLTVVAVVVVFALVLVYALSQFLGRRSTSAARDDTTALDEPVGSSTGDTTGAADAAVAAPADPTVEVVRPSTWPSRAEDVSPTPLGVPGPVPEGGGPHEFLSLQPDGVTPVAYDPCRPIHFVTRPGGPPEGDILIREAIAAVSTATGLRFVDDGTTEEGPSDERAAFQPEVYGDRWAPVLFTWSDTVESPRLGEISADAPQADPAAYAGSIAVGLRDEGSEDGDLVYVTGSVTLDQADLTDLLAGPDGRAAVRSVIQHEVAHLVGLGHVGDTTQLMHPQMQPGTTSFGAGDLQGLAALGSGACYPDI